MLLHHNLDIHQRERDGIVILDLKGPLTMGPSDTALREFVQGLVQAGNHQLTLNMADVSEIDTSGMGALLTLAEQYRNAGGKLALFNIDHSHGKVYEMARLEAAVEIYRDELDAINSFFPDRAVPRYDILEYIEHQNNSEPHPMPEKK